MSRIFRTEEEVLDVVEKAILLFREQGMTRERFSQTNRPVWASRMWKKQLLANDLLERKQEILDATLHVTGGASC